MKKHLRIIAAMLTVIITLEIMPIEALAIDIKNGTFSNLFQDNGNPVVEDFPEEDLSVIGELEEKRDLYTKDFRLSDGTSAAVQYDTEVHYKDDSGEWQQIDNSLHYEKDQETQGISLFSAKEETDDVQDTDGYTTKAGKVNFKFAKNANQKNLVRIQQDDYKVSFALQNRNENKKVTIENSESSAENDSLESQMTVDNIYSTVNYNNIQDDVDLQYIASGSDLKENIIINKVKDEYTFSFDIKTHKLNIVQEDDGSISLYDYKSNKLIYSIPAMYMEDSNGEQSESITCSLKQVKKKRYVLTITADAAWINDKEREFPVTIDPTLVSKHTSTGSEKTEIFNYYVTSNHPNQKYGGNGAGFLGYDSSSDKKYRQFVQFKKLPSIPMGSVILSSKMYYAQTSYSNVRMPSLCIVAKRVTGNTQWKSATTWNTQPKFDDTILDYQYLSQSTNKDYVGWDITPLIKEHYESQQNDYKSFVLTAYDESALNDKKCAKAKIIQDNSSGYFTGAQPLLEIVYRDTRGIEDYYGNTSQDIGRAGTAYIGDYNDQLTLIKDDITNNGSAIDFTLSHVYNSTTCYANFTRDSNMHTMKYAGMCIGRGWRLSIQQTMVKQIIGGETYYVYSDGDGTEHYFYFDKEKNQYVDEDGLNLTLSFWTNSANKYVYITMQDKKGNQQVFVNGYLVKIQDANENKIYITYNGKNYSTSSVDWSPKIEATSGTIADTQATGIVQINNGKTPVTVAKLNYNGGYLTSIEDQAGRITKYTYSAPASDGVKNLIGVTHPDGTTVDYSYYSGAYLCDARDNESGDGIAYTYYAYPRLGILTVTEYSKQGDNIVTGSKMSIGNREIHRTTFRDYGTDAIRENEDDTFTYLTFDNSGRTVNTMSTNYDRTKMYGVDVSSFTTNSHANSGTNNRVTADVATGLRAVNLLLNSSAEFGSDGYADNWTYSGAGQNIAGAVRTDSLTRTGFRGFKIYMNPDSSAPDENGNLYGSYSQSVQLQGGKTYTFSGYVKTTNGILHDDSAAFLSVKYPDGSEVCSKEIDYKTPNTIEDGWERVTLTFTPNTTGSYKVMSTIRDIGNLCYWDDFQLEEGEAASSYNMVDDGSFETSGTWTCLGSSLDSQTKQHGGKSMRMNGAPSSTVQCYQWVPVNQKADNTYVLSGWAKANSVLDTSSTTCTTKYFGYYVDIWYTDQTKETVYVPFNPDITDWQFTSAIIQPKKENAEKTISRMAVMCLYNKNVNTAWFDNISLKKEPAQTYTYDDEGNLVAVNQKGESETSSKYKTGTQDLTEIVSGSGKFEYTYDDKTHAVKSVKNDTITMNSTYDSIGNSTKTSLSSSVSGTKKVESYATYSDDGNYLKSQTNNTGSTVTYNTDTKTGLISDMTDGAGIKTNYQYNFYNSRQISSSIGDKIKVSRSYNRGRLSAITREGSLPGSLNKLNQIYKFDYDVYGNPLTVKIGDNALISYTYGPNNSNLLRTTYANGNSIELVYDDLDRIIAEKYNGVVRYKYIYNSEGEMAKKVEVDANGQVINAVGFEYDSLERTIHSWEERNENGKIFEVQRSEHVYDSEDRIVSQKWSVGGQEERSESYKYNPADGTLTEFTTANKENVSFIYDGLKRISKRTGSHVGMSYEYYDMADGQRTTTQVKNVSYSGLADSLQIGYTYDGSVNSNGQIQSTKRGNITAIHQKEKDKSCDVEYQYDDQNQLISETFTTPTGETSKYEYVYDTYGNIRQVKKYENSPSVPMTINYDYSNASWLDQLTSYNGQAITYDASGNPLHYNNGTSWDFSWNGGWQLASATSEGKSLQFHYDMDGIRDSKTVNGVKHEYITQGGHVVLERWDGHELEIIYDNSENPYSFIYDGITYYYVLNPQGDVIRIVDGTGATVVEYTYNAWGEVLNVSDASTFNLGDINPIRYRGYYYDVEMQMYYLQSRYYDPVVKRLLNADDPSTVTSEANELVSLNIYTYCYNNPIAYTDDEGDCPVVAVIAEMAIGGGIELAAQVISNGGFKDIQWKDVAWAAVTSGLSFGLGDAVKAYSFVAKNRKIIEPVVDIACDVTANFTTNALRHQSLDSNVTNCVQGVASSGMSMGVTYAASKKISGAVSKKVCAKLNKYSKAKQRKVLGVSKKRAAKRARKKMPVKTWPEYTARIEKKVNRIKRKLSIAINTALSVLFKKWGKRKK